ncbi:alanine--glyoxylate aminotransferase family protein [Helicobacter sp. MIT 21-1697]|uniref:pyridoxal-phosphate-dependent aminotransferase family protein n=1 Tax=Helicobacter sp. MIT 21-1697 TaxID=2993733 RepID=UPI00224A8EAE|nr:alanine--glyoxylate aminotransferase family protein [Helicobacter sp. MIT 21-1697]MCX2716893.1 alanine--glyoxylate aminotransferase family protein [Helicobacter sp. MIT 21-1697]
MLLFTPGPTPVPESIRKAMSEPTLHHRTPEFESIFAKARAGLLELLKMPEVLMLASSGSGAMEACVCTFTQKKMLSINSGKFGERFGKIAASAHIPYREIINDWDTPVSVESVLKVLNEESEIDCFCIQMCESAGGLRHPVEEIAKAIKAYNPHIVVVVDAITAMGVEEIDTTHIDALIGGSQKAFMLPPGLSIIGLSQYGIELANKRNVGFYFNLKTELKNQSQNTTAWTAPTTIITGLTRYFELINGNIQQVYAQTKARSLATHKALESLGLRIYPKNPALAMNTIYDEVNAAPLRKILKNEFSLNVAGGQDKLKTSIMRINQMGLIPLNESVWVINAIELALERLNLRKFDGTGNKVFLTAYYDILDK